MTSKSYTAKSIEVLTGLDPVKKRPGMYTDTRNPNHLAQEVIDNAVDEALGGHAHHIRVVHHQDASLSVWDDGRGMPVDIHPDEKISGVELILTRLHAGGKFSHDQYQFAGGLHGVGVSVVNALSSKVEVSVIRNGFLHEIHFQEGAVSRPLQAIKKMPKTQSGTGVRFWPQVHYFDSPHFQLSKLQQLLKAKAILCPGLQIDFLDEVTGESTSWQYVAGLADYLKGQLSGEWLPESPFEGDFSGKTESISWAMVWCFDDPGPSESYVNLIPTPQGGTHVAGFRQGLSDALRDFCDRRHLTPKGLKLSPEDVFQHCAYILSLKMQDPQFSGQTKERLSSREASAFASGILKDALSLWLNQHVETGEKIANQVIQSALARQKSTQQIARKRLQGGPKLPGKLADCTLSGPKGTEIFFVEGNSAGGSARQARDRIFQAVLPLRGKILNTWEVQTEQLWSSQTIQDIALALGLQPGVSDLSALRYERICILADADSDGLHIATLIIALFLKHFPDVVANGFLYVAMPPLYRIDIGKSIFYALDEAEKKGILERIEAEKIRGKVNLQRFKGLGEMNPQQLRETTMDPNSRRLLQLTLSDLKESSALLDLLLAKKRASDRKTWLEAKGNLAEV